MKILILNPPFGAKHGRYSRTSRSPAITKSGTLYYPIWLAYAAGVLESDGHDLKLIDAPAAGQTENDVQAIARQFQPRLIIVDTSTPSIYSDVSVAAALKESLEDCFVTLVGTHPSALPEATLRLDVRIDAVAVGEYDYTVRDLARALRNKSSLDHVNGLAFRRSGELVRTAPRAPIQDVDALPFVSSVYRRHLDPRDYFFAAAQYPMMMIMTGRGCPGRCFFCVYPQTFHGRAYRARTPANVVDEFESITVNSPEVKEIGIEDDTFTMREERAREICRLIIERGVKIDWYANVRAHLSLETMQWMKRAGCRLVTVGFESANQQVLNGMRKGIRVEQIRQFAANARQAGMMVHGCFMAGNPGETPETLQESIDLAKELNTDTMQFFPLMVYPGTEAYAWAEANGYLATTDFSQWLTEDGMHNCVISLPGLSSRYLVEFCDRARREYYLRPSYIWRKAKQVIAHPTEMQRTAKSFFTFLRPLIRGSLPSREKEARN